MDHLSAGSLFTVSGQPGVGGDSSTDGPELDPFARTWRMSRVSF